MNEFILFFALTMILCLLARVMWKIFKVAIYIVVGYLVLGALAILSLLTLALLFA